MFRYFVFHMTDVVLLWLALLLLLHFGVIYILVWKGLDRIRFPFSTETHRFSVIIAARNEEHTIESLLHSITAIEYPKNMFEVIIVNDRSEDNTLSIIEKYIPLLGNARVITIKENASDMPNKKNALRTGIDAASYDILAFTDADCIVPKNWLTELSKSFSGTVGVVAGYSPYRFDTKNWFHDFLEYEELMNSIGAAATIGLRRAFMCTGRNFAYRKEVFHEVGGYEKIKHSISGDDDLFIQLVQKHTKWEIRYMTAPESVVRTIPPETISRFIQQRIRHISASKYYPSSIALSFASLHIFLLVNILLFFFSPLAGLMMLFIRLNGDALLAARGMKIFPTTIGIIQFFRSELFWLLYPLIIGPLGLFGKFDWKGPKR